MDADNPEDAVNHKLRSASPQEIQCQPLNQTVEKQQRQEQSTRKGRGCQIEPIFLGRKLVDHFLVLPCQAYCEDGYKDFLSKKQYAPRQLFFFQPNNI